ncbi:MULTISPECIES: hypothetical protein [Stenotrophomonas]|uniref:hypothetical protein n=1 Tax=Stenotrophomonas TaxID=40323 RepID=UPI00114CA332|nr:MULTISPECIES: hypothetical protein [Stenotrophomonas]
MTSIVDLARDGKFDGALLFDGDGDYRGRKNIVGFNHAGDILGLARVRRVCVRAEFLYKVASQVSSVPSWDDARSPCICSSVEETAAMIADFAADGSPAA